jgi:3-oxoadipate enol-lactonase
VNSPLALARWPATDPNAPVVVLLHGVGGSRASFGDEVSGTAAALAGAGFDAVAPDLPGYGGSPTVEPYTMATLAAALGTLIDGLDASRVAIVGHSMGGMVAQEFMALASVAQRTRIAALVLMATSPSFGPPGGAWQAEFLAQRLAPLDAGQGMAKLAPGLALGMASPQASHEAVARAALIMAAVPEATYRRALAAIADFDRRESLADLALPVLCLAGADDRNAPATVMRRMAERIAGAEYRCLDGVGHLAHMEAGPVVNPVLIDFLRRQLG